VPSWIQGRAVVAQIAHRLLLHALSSHAGDVADSAMMQK
jgi:hypothetical protein